MHVSSKLGSVFVALVLTGILLPVSAFAESAAYLPGKEVSLTAQAIGTYGVDLASESYQTAINPYYAYRGSSADGSGGECTWYAWGRAYEKIGVKLPGPDDGRAWHAKYWAANCAAYGYLTGNEPLTNSIMVENDDTEYGHVYFVERVENGYAYVTEGNYLGKYNEDAINLSTKVRDSWPGHTLGTLSYIYLIQENPLTVTAPAAQSVSVPESAAGKTFKGLVAAKGAAGAVTFAKKGGSPSLSVNASGDVTLAKGAKVARHSMTVAVSAAGGGGYGPGEKTVTVIVEVVEAPAKPKPVKAAPAANAVKLSWGKVPGATGYRIAYTSSPAKALSGDCAGWATLDVGKGSATSKKVAGLKAGKVYWFRIRALKASNGREFASGWSAALVMEAAKSPSCYMVKYSANGGSGVMPLQVAKVGKTATLAANKFARAGYKFAGWNTRADGKGKAYADKAKVKNLAKAGKTVTLYAQWKKLTETASFSTFVKGSAYTSKAGRIYKNESYKVGSQYKYKLSVTYKGKTKVLSSSAYSVYITNGRYVFYCTEKLAANNTFQFASFDRILFRFDTSTGVKKRIAAGTNLAPFTSNGKYLYYGRHASQATGRSTLYALDLSTWKKKSMDSKVTARHSLGVTAKFSSPNGVLATANTMNEPIPAIYSYKIDGTGIKLLAKDVYACKLSGSKVTYIVEDYSDMRNLRFKLFQCSITGKSRKALSGWTSDRQSLMTKGGLSYRY